jgi:small-conductance mechanosensitive channel
MHPGPPCGISLLIDRPVKIGDSCEFGGVIGTIESLGLRAVRIRTPDRTQACNTDFAFCK